MPLVRGDGAVRPDRRLQPRGHPGPVRRRDHAERSGHQLGAAQDARRQEIGQGVVADGELSLGGAADVQPFVAAIGLGGDAAGDPVGHARHHRPGALAAEAVVGGDVGVEAEGPRHVQADVVFPGGARAGAGRGLLAGRWRRFPREPQALEAVHPGVVADLVQMAAAEVEQRLGRRRLQHAQQRRREGVDVPHDVAEVVVIVPPGREAEDRGGRRRGGMHRGVQIVEPGVGQGLPLGVGAHQPDAAAPDFGPGVPIALPQRVEAEFHGADQQAQGVRVRLVVHQGGHEAGHLAEADRTAAPEPDPVARLQGAGIVPGVLRPFRLRRPLRGQGEAAARGLAVRSPEQDPVAGRLGLARGLGAPAEHPPADV